MKWVALIVFWLICGIVGTVIGNSRNVAGTGFPLGFLLGPPGVLLTLLVEGRPTFPLRAEPHEPDARPQTPASPRDRVA
jgi:hypothetical protein